MTKNLIDPRYMQLSKTYEKITIVIFAWIFFINRIKLSKGG